MIIQESMDGFRQKLAGLIEEETASPEIYRELAAKCVCFLARHYNRDVLDAKAIWHRIESAIKTGFAKYNGDPTILLSEMLEHVKADIGRTVSDPDFIELLSLLRGVDKNWSEGFARYMNGALYTAIVLGRVKWESEKEKGR